MKTEPTPFDLYVRRRLDAWGREFRLDRDFELLGHRSKDILQVLIEHKGEMPERSDGFRPLTIPPLEMQIEDIVHDIHRDARHLAVVLRAFYCGSGRAGVERRELAEEILRIRIPKQRFYEMHERGFHRVSGALGVVNRAA